ncbi:unnamed protein product, partial [Rotaria magnacalcarata]
TTPGTTRGTTTGTRRGTTRGTTTGTTRGTTRGTTPGTTPGTTSGTRAGTTSTVHAKGETTITIGTEETKAVTAGSTTAGEVKTTSEVEESTQGTTRKVVKTTGETAPTVLTTGATTPQPAETTTTTFQCNHMEYIDKLIASNSVSIVSENIANKEDLIKSGVDFVELNPIIVIDIPKNGAIVRDVKVTSTNAAAIVVTLTTVEGETLSPIRGNPTSLPNHEFPTELVAKIVIEILETTDNHSPKQVTLSVVACAPGVTVGTTEGTTPGTTTGAVVGGSTKHHRTTEAVEGTLGVTEETLPGTEISEKTTLGRFSATTGSDGVVSLTKPTAHRTAVTSKAKATTEERYGSSKYVEGTLSKTVETLPWTDGITRRSGYGTDVTMETRRLSTVSNFGTQRPRVTTSQRGSVSGDVSDTTHGTKIVHTPSETTTHKPITLTEKKCTNIQDVVQLGSKVFASVSINGMPIKTASIPIWLAVTDLPFVIKATFKHSAILREVSIVNPSESQVSLIKVATDQTNDVFSMNSYAPTVTFENDLEYVGDLTITLLSTRDNMLPENPVKLAILACWSNETFRTKAVVEPTSATTNVSSSLLSTYPSSNPSKHKTIPDIFTTTSDTCEDDIAVIPDQSNHESNPLIPRYFVQPRTPYQPSNINPGEIGVSFPASDKPYIIIFPMAQIAIIKSVKLPKTTNVDQMRVMFLDAEDKPIMTHPSDQIPLKITSQVATSPKINVQFSTKVNSVHITLLHTSDNQPPQDVTVEIVVCVEPTIITPKTNVTEVETHTVPTTNHISSQPSSDSPCKPKYKYSARITIGACISQQEIQHESCVGYCPSYEQLDPLTGNVAGKECSCCAPDSTYTESIIMDCSNTTTGRKEQQTTQITRIRSCKCSICLGRAKESYSNKKGTHETTAKTNPTTMKTKTRRR